MGAVRQLTAAESTPQNKSGAGAPDKPFAALSEKDMRFLRRYGTKAARMAWVLQLLRMKARAYSGVAVEMSAAELAHLGAMSSKSAKRVLHDLTECNYLRKHTGLQPGGNVANCYEILPPPMSRSEAVSGGIDSSRYDNSRDKKTQGARGGRDKKTQESGTIDPTSPSNMTQGGRDKKSQLNCIEQPLIDKVDVDTESNFDKGCSADAKPGSPTGSIRCILAAGGVGRGSGSPWEVRENLARRMLAVGLTAQDAESALRKGAANRASARIGPDTPLAKFAGLVEKHTLTNIGQYAKKIIKAEVMRREMLPMCEMLARVGVGLGARRPAKQRSDLAASMLAAGLTLVDVEIAARNAAAACAAGKIDNAKGLEGWGSQMPKELLKRVGGYAVGVIERAIDEGQLSIKLNPEVVAMAIAG